MNPRRLWDFLRSKFGLFVVFVVVLFTGLAIYGRRQGETRPLNRVSSAKKVDVGKVRVPLDKGLENGVPQTAAPVPAKEPDSSDGQLVPFHPPSAPTKPAPPPPAEAKKAVALPPQKIRLPSLVSGYVEPHPTPVHPAPPRDFVPYGTLLKCKLVNTVDSSNIETPIIALLLEDVWQNGARLLPANTLIHGTARAGRIRDRVSTGSAWRFVWQDGRELTFAGLALDREYDHEVDGYGLTDGSAGIRGRILTTDEFQEIKLIASAALSGFARGTQDRTTSLAGTTLPGSVANGVREGTAEVFELYAQRILKDLEQNGRFVRVPAGKEFYVYVAERIEPGRARPLTPETLTKG